MMANAFIMPQNVGQTGNQKEEATLSEIKNRFYINFVNALAVRTDTHTERERLTNVNTHTIACYNFCSLILCAKSKAQTSAKCCLHLIKTDMANNI